MEALIPDLVLSLRTLGIDLRLDDGKLIARPSSLISPDIRKIIATHRDELCECLERKDPTVGHSNIDAGIRRFDAITLPRERMVLSLERSLSRYAHTGDPLWAEVAAIWAQCIGFIDAITHAWEELDSTEATAAA